jgi:hypothetical protein
MKRFSTDADVLRVSAAVFAEETGLPVLCRGEGGTISGTSFIAPGADFFATGVTAGRVIWLRSGDGKIDGAYEVVERISTTELTVSVIRGDECIAVGPGDATTVSYRVATLDAKGQDAAYFLTQYFGVRPGFADVSLGRERIVDDTPLRKAEVYGILADVYSGRAVAVGTTAAWDTAESYRRMYEAARRRCRLWMDDDGDGQGDTAVDGGSFRVKRE